ncbi:MULTISPECIES: DUF6274 family protein [Streptomyces]|uniref:Uncharacterized protein n=1 Tax=Streptomyces mordarskii TaxID=1226758 RepID=A0ABP3M1X1_9ACTN|nr:DUF6274 family protein [Streptomyces sp. WAC05858]RSS39772.1 hypothetical protein EF902_26625 [Streptomyces sp. WAC05858]WTB06501.1 DUF6274 family protein [Streptomyces antimycoticus]
MTTSARHETRALLRAHLAAAAGYRHFTRHCPICHRLLRLAMEPSAADEAGDGAGDGAGNGVGDEADDGVGHQATAAAPPPTR